MSDTSSAALRFALAPTVGGAPAARLARASALRAYLARETGLPVEVVIAESYEASLAGLRSGDLDAAMLGELAYWRARESASAEALVTPVREDGAFASYQSAIVTVRGTGIESLAGLRGALFGLVDAQSASGYLVPRAMLREAGLDPDRDVTVRLMGGHRLVIEGLLRGELEAGAVHAGSLTPPRPEAGPDYARLVVLARSRPIPRGPLVVRAGLPAETRLALAHALLRIHEADPAAAQVLNVGAGQRFIQPTRRTLPTLRCVADLAGVSYATVSRVVNRSGDVAPATAARVQAIVDELGYRPNGNALVLRGERAPLVGFLLPAWPTPAALRLANALRERLTEAGIPFVLCPVAGAVAASPFPELLLDGRLGALFCSAGEELDPSLQEAIRTERIVIPVVERPVDAEEMTRPVDDAVATLVERFGLSALRQARTGRATRRSRRGEISPSAGG